MKSTQQHLQVRASVIAVGGAMAAMALWPAAYAAEDAAAAMTRPTNTVEVGAGATDSASKKFGEYNGLDKKGGYVNGAFDVRGGAAQDGDSALRWRINATDLGLHTRTMGAEFGEQGRFRFDFGYDEIQRKQYDGFQTIYSGAGSNYLYLADPRLKAASHPAAITISAANLANPAQAANVAAAQNANALASFTNIQSPNLNPGTYAAPNIVAATSAAAANAGLGWLIPAAMNSADIGTLRTKSNFGAAIALTPDLSFKFSALHETKEGLKLTGVGSVDTGHGVTLPEPVKYTTNLYSGAFNYAGRNSHVTFGYYGSTFKNAVDTWMADSIWANNAVQNNTDRMVGTPDNQMHQFKLAGGYNFSKATKLTVAGSYAQATQNEGFITGPLWYLPDTSAHAKIINTNFLARLTSRVSNNLNVLASYRYEDRDNRTPYMQTISTGRDAVGAAAATSPCGPGALPATAAVTVSGLTCYDNAPINIRKQQLTLEGDWAFVSRQVMKFGYAWEQIKRSSDEAGQDPFRAHRTREQTLKLQYLNSVSETMNGRIGYDYSQRRRSEYELEDPLGGVLGAAVEPMLPNLYNFMVANRDRDRVRSAINWVPADRIAFGAGLDYNNDKYREDGYGKKEARSWVLNLDGSWAVADNFGLRGFYTYEDQKSNMESLSVLRATNVVTAITNPTPINPVAAACRAYPSTAGYAAAAAAPNNMVAVGYGSPADWNSDPCRIWREAQSDKVHTLGVNMKAKATPRLDLDGVFTYTYVLTPISFSGMQVVSNGLSVGAPALVNNNIFIPTANMPDSKSRMWTLGLAGKYALDKSSSLRVSYRHSRLVSNDAQWDAYANNPVAIQGYVGSNAASPNYKVNAISVSYIYSFN